MGHSPIDPTVERTLSAWSQLPDVEKLSGRLSVKDEAFLGSVGSLLAERRQTSRFAVTLLHSHFGVLADEALVESFDDDRRYLVTVVLPLVEVEKNKEIVIKSWKFNEDPTAIGVEELVVMTWGRRADIPQAPLSSDDAGLLRDLASIYRENRVSNIFGMALVGNLPDSDQIWTEGTDLLGRLLVQEQLPTAEVEARNPIKTMWVFDEEGRFLITLGCCLRTRDGSGHTGRVHPPGS